jgi:MFS family permease
MPDGQDAAPAWKTLLALFTLASFIETLFWGQVIGFTPLYLAQLGVAPHAIATWTGTIAALSMALGLPFLPLWGALADRYARKPVIVRSFAAYLIAGIVTFLAPNVWIFTLGRAVMGFSFGNSGLMMTTLSEHAPPRRVGIAFAIMNSAAPIGVFVGPLVGGMILTGPRANHDERMTRRNHSGCGNGRREMTPPPFFLRASPPRPAPPNTTNDGKRLLLPPPDWDSRLVSTGIEAPFTRYALGVAVSLGTGVPLFDLRIVAI